MNKYVDWGINMNFIFISTWSQTRRNVRVAANMFQSISFFGKPPPVMFFDHLMVIVGATIVNHFFHQVAAKSRFISWALEDQFFLWRFRDWNFAEEWTLNAARNSLVVCVSEKQTQDVFRDTFNYIHIYIYIY